MHERQTKEPPQRQLVISVKAALDRAMSD